MARWLARMPFVLGGLALALAVLLALRESWLPARYLTLARISGLGSALALALTLCVTPLARLWRGLREAELRRSLGILAAGLALVHALVAHVLVLDAALVPLWNVPRLRAGLCALVILLALWLSSYPSMVRALRLRLWKELHVLAYLAGTLVLQHVLLAPHASRRLALGTAAVVLGVGLLRLRPRR
jgi:sulfoxide reductase heme-binding subunit YedZ